MVTLNAKDLILDQVHQSLNLQESNSLSFDALLSLDELTDFEQLFYLQAGDPATDQVLPEINLIDVDRAL